MEDDEPQSTQAKALVSPRKRKLPKVQTVPNEFFGVYCLISRSPLKHYKNRCYIGYTVDPNRRIRQHNGGKEKGGAKKTDNRGPWDMVCIIHGFPNSVAALRFEWAWQNPEKSRVIKDLALKKIRKETPFAYRLRVACHLMNSRPFDRFALTFRWLLPLEELPFPEEVLPPKHVLKKYGLIEKSTSEVPSQKDGYVERGECRLCGEDIEMLSQFVRCPSAACAAHFHAKCLASHGLSNDRCQLYPLEGKCPRYFYSSFFYIVHPLLLAVRVSCCFRCGRQYLWGDVIRDQRMVLKIDEAQTDSSLKGLVPRASSL
ncbi:GIY-YIG catalytic domain protein [Ancylostoma duodenale]|uniref:Structure-specific endonuclease subunit SLX1 homolog n=1 Tax=Ancylostoma duodenale TaxID=51022 RepID=A0A0C2CL18_9BILA|nr:GIY-YIG catalytic domain protein [Ancylostoma duodenale]